VLLLSIVALAIAVVSGLSQIGTKIVNKYSTEVPKDFDQEMIMNISGLVHSTAVVIPSIKPFEKRNRDLFNE